MEQLLNDRLLAILLLMVTFLYIGYTYKTSNSDIFHTAKRNVGMVRSIATLFTVVGAPHFAIFTALAFFLGWFSLSFYLGAFIGLVIMSTSAKRIRNYIDSDAHSFNDIAFNELGRTPAVLFTAIGVIYVLGVVIAQLILGAHLLAEFSNLSYSICLLIIVLTIIGYLLWGGYSALVNTDVIQGFIMLIFTLLLISYSFKENVLDFNELIFFPASLSIFSPITPLLFIGGILATTGSPEIWQRVLTARNDKTARRSLITAGLTMFLWGIMVVGIGVIISMVIPESEPSNAFVIYITNFLPKGVLGLVSVLIVAAILSTSDTEIFVATILTHKEINRKTSNYKNLNIKTSRYLIVLFGVVTGAGALLLDDLISVWGILLNLVYISAPLALSVLLRRGAEIKLKNKRYLFSHLSYPLLHFYSLRYPLVTFSRGGHY